MFLVKNMLTNEEVIVYNVEEKYGITCFLVYEDGCWTYTNPGKFRPLTTEESIEYNRRQAMIQVSAAYDKAVDEGFIEKSEK